MSDPNLIKGKGPRWIAAGVAALGLLILGIAFLGRRPAAPAAETPAPPKSSPRLARITDEGSLTRTSPEEEFLSVVSRTAPKTPIPLDSKDAGKDFPRILGSLRGLFARMRDLAAAFKKTDPARYAAEMESLKEELSALMQAAQVLLRDSEAAAPELFRAIREEEDPVVKDRLSFLLRFVDPGKAGPFAVGLSDSPSPADRKAAIGYLQGLRTEDSARALLRRADGDPEMELRQRALVGMGRLLAGPSPELGRYREEVLGTLRKYTQPAAEAPLRAAAWDAFSLVPVFAEEDRERLRVALRTEPDPVVRKSVENALRHLNVRDKAAADRYNPKSRIVPR